MGQNRSRPTPKIVLCGRPVLTMPRDVRQLHSAVMWNQWKVVQQLAESGTDVDHVWYDLSSPSVKNGTTPLCEAVSLNHVRVVDVLIQAGAQVNKPDQFGLAPLHKAAFHGRAALVERLVEAGADIHCRDPERNTPLHVCLQQCVVHSSSEAVLAFLEAGASVNVVNIYGLTALHYAASWAAQDIVRILIKANAEIDCTDRLRKTPLHYCITAISYMNRRLCGNDIVTNHPSISRVRDTKWKYSILRKRLPTINILLMAGCDPLNLATWFRQNYSIEYLSTDKVFYSSYMNTMPECLKHLCRIAILKSLGQYPDFTVLNDLPLPTSLVKYLSRKLL